MTEEEYSKIESKAIESYIQDIYSHKVPEPLPPSKKQLSFWEIAGIESILFTLSGLGVIIFSSVRTGGLFFILESLLLKEYNLGAVITNTFSVISMAASLFAFELFVAADGFSKGKENTSIKRSRIGVMSSLGVIILAGIFSGMGLLTNIDPTIKTTFYIIIAFATAIAGGLVAYYSGENIGFTFSTVAKTRQKLVESHQTAYQTWRESAVRAYTSSHYNISSEKGSKFAQTMEKYKIGTEKSTENEQSTNAVQNGYNVHKNATKLEQSYIAVGEFVKKHKRLPTTDELVSAGISRGYASQSMNKFIVDYAEFLLTKGIANQERINKAVLFMEKNPPIDSSE